MDIEIEIIIANLTLTDIIEKYKIHLWNKTMKKYMSVKQNLLTFDLASNNLFKNKNIYLFAYKSCARMCVCEREREREREKGVNHTEYM